MALRVLWRAMTVAGLFLNAPGGLRAQASDAYPLDRPFRQPVDLFATAEAGLLRVDDRVCDSPWDGLLFGVLPGVGIGVLTIIYRSNDNDNTDAILWAGVIGGAVVGWALDATNCAPPKRE